MFLSQKILYKIIANEIDSALIKRRNFTVKLLHERQDRNIINAE